MALKKARASKERTKETPPELPPPLNDDEDYKAALRATRELEARVAFLEAELPLKRKTNQWL